MVISIDILSHLQYYIPLKRKYFIGEEIIMPLLSIHKLLEYAVQLEDRGEKFFLEWAEKADSDALKKFFKLLAEEEGSHLKIFQELLERVGAREEESMLPVEFNDYFETFTELLSVNEEEMKKTHELQAAIELAKKMELDALLFFTEIKNFLHIKYEAIIQQIIAEERQHFTKLSELGKKMFEK
jgi:rubrerythrin